MILNNLPPLLVVIPLLLAPVAAIIPIAPLGWVLATLGTGAAFVIALLLQSITTAGLRVTYNLGNWAPPWGIEFIVDGAASLTLVVTTGLAFAATLYARRSIAAEIAEGDVGKTYAAWLLACGGLSGLVMTGDAFNLFVFLEISALGSVILIAMGAGRVRRALIAAYNYLIIGAVGATFYVIGVGFTYAMTGTLNMADLAARLPEMADSTVIYVGFGFMVAGLLVKAAVFPVHIWLPSAYSYAPSAVSTLLAAIATKAAIYVLARIIFTVFGGLPELTGLALIWVIIPLSIAGIFSGTILAIYESDLKKMLAFSSIAQIGYITLGLGIATSASVAASFIHIGNHAVIKGGLFMAVGAFFLAVGQRISLDNIAGLGRRMPITTAAFLVCGLSLIGLPLTAGFISKLYLVRALIDADQMLIMILVLVSSALSVIYLWQVVELLWASSEDDAATKRGESPALYIPLWIIAGANIWLGIFPSALTDAAALAARALGAGA